MLLYMTEPSLMMALSPEVKSWPLLPLLILALTVPESEEPAFSYHSRLHALLRQTLQYHPQGPGLGKPVALNGIPEGDHPGRCLEGLA